MAALVNVNINNRPDLLIMGCCNFTVSMHDSVQRRLNQGEVLTNARAVEILKQVKLKSDVMWFITKPIVVIPFSIALLIGSFCIPATTIVALAILNILLCGVAGGLVGFTIQNTWNNMLPQLSQAYSDQSQEASALIVQLEANPDVVPTMN